MAEFLETIESIRAEDASVQKLFSGEGQSVRGQKTQAYMQKLGEAAKFLGEVIEGKRPTYHLQEAMTTDDFPQLFGDVLDRQLLAEYQAFPQTYRNFVHTSTVPDFRTVKRFTVSGADSTLNEVQEQAEYPESNMSDSEYSYAVKKFGRRIPFSWEAIMNDDLDALRDVPRRFARAAARTEQKFATELYVDSSGPHASLYTGGTNQLSSNDTLSISGLQNAMELLSQQTDSNGEPIYIEMVHLVVPPALEVTARNILQSTQIELNTAGGSTNQKLIAQNWMRDRVKLSVDPYIPIVASSSNGNTSWFLFADPGNNRPALEMGFLRGHTSPEVFIKSPNASRPGGGQVNAMDGDFDTDSIQYKVRHILGGTRMDSKMTVASDGSGS